jgi:outer membrane protein, heavy metal efflux system
MQVMYDKGQVGILDYNKAKIAALEQSFRVVDFQAQIKNLESQLTTLNGGAPIELTLTAFDNEIVLPSFDVLWEEKRQADPWLLRLAMEEDISQNQIRLSKSQRLPSITAGYNQQGVAGDVYSGVYAGLSIPLWSGGKQVQLAKANAHFQSIAVESNLQRKRSEVEQSYNTYLFLLDQMQELRSTLANQQSEQLLKTAYEMGELSYLDYYRELQFFQSAANRLLDLEKRLHLVKSELLKHRL